MDVLKRTAGLRVRALLFVFALAGCRGLCADDIVMAAPSELTAGITVPGTNDYPDAGLQRLGSVDFNLEYVPRRGVIDTIHGYAYFGTYTAPGRVIKVDIKGAEPRLVAITNMGSGETFLSSAVIDPMGGYAYFGTGTNPRGIVVKVALGEGDDPPVRVGAVRLPSGEDSLVSAVINPNSGYAWFASYSGSIIKIALGTGATPPTRLAGLDLAPGEANLQSFVIDTANNYGYIGSYEGGVVKVDLGESNAAPVRLGAAPLLDGEYNLQSGVIDALAGYAYFGASGDTAGTAANIVKVALGEGDELPYRVGGVQLNIDEDYAHSAVIDPAAGLAYFGLDDPYGSVVSHFVKIGLGNGDEPPTRRGALTMPAGDWDHYSSVLDPDAGFIYSGTNTPPSKVIKIGISNKGELNATRITIPTTGVITAASFYSHAAKGRLRMSIHDADNPGQLLWESDSVVNSAENAFLKVPINSGTPSSLTLAPGDYWLGWQVDTNADVASLVPGEEGQGLQLSQPYGNAPLQLASSEAGLTPDQWATYLSYLPPRSGRSTGDFNNSGCTNIIDLFYLIEHWHDPIVNPPYGLGDFLNLLAYWRTGSNCHFN